MAKKAKFDSEAAFKAIIGEDKTPIEGQVNLDDLIGSPADLQQKTETQPPKTSKNELAKTKETPKKAGRPKLQRETKKRMSFTILPSLYEEATKIAYTKGKSMSELICDLLTEYVEKHG